MTAANYLLPAQTRSTTRQAFGLAPIVGALAICAVLLVFFAHLVQKQVERGETLRQAQRAGVYALREASALRPKRASSNDSRQLIAGNSPP